MNGWDQLIWIGGVVIVGALAVNALSFVFGSIRSVAHQRQQQQRERLLWETRLSSIRLQQQQAAEGIRGMWSGWRKFQVTRKVPESADASICSFHLKPHDGKPIPGFTPGQFLTFRAPVPGEPKSLVRCYSLSGPPVLGAPQTEYRVSIKRVPADPRDPESRPGRCSNFFHDTIDEGDLLDVKPPSGSFVLDLNSDAPVVLIGGGVGLTPMASMLHAIVAGGGNREVWFFYGVRHGSEHAMVDELRELTRESNVHLHVCYSNPRDTDQPGVHFDHAERVSVDLFKRVLPSNNYQFYMCGPGPMMDSLTADLEAWGVPDPNVHLESFGPSAPTLKAKTADPAADGPQVTFRRSEQSAPWDPQLNHLWEFAQANGVTIDSGCLLGNCGSCETAIVSGKVTYPNGTPDFECNEGNCLVCCAQPDGPVELDA